MTSKIQPDPHWGVVCFMNRAKTEHPEPVECAEPIAWIVTVRMPWDLPGGYVAEAEVGWCEQHGWEAKQREDWSKYPWKHTKRTRGAA